MKNKYKFLMVAVFFCYSSFSQTNTGTLYSSGQWADIKGKGSWAKAMENPTYEKVEVLVTSKYIKAKFGTKAYNYTIESLQEFSKYRMDYHVILNGKKYILSIADMQDGTYALNIDGLWMVSDIRDIKTIELK